MRRFITRIQIILMVLCAALTVVATAPAEAQAQTANLSVRVILATNNGSSMDPSLRGISGQLTSRFGGYSNFSQLASHSVSLTSGASRSISLPNGQSMSLRFEGMSGNSFRIGVSLPGGGTTVTAAPGGIFFVAGPPHSGGILIIAISS